jgi:hypothetical protein
MPLPTLESAKYKITIPSTGKTIEYRPFLVKEEKILLMAQESEDSNEIARALKDIIHSCTFEKINVNELATYDLEYIFLQLRAKSVGEEVIVQLPCDKCEEYTELKIDLSSIKIKKPKKKVDPNIKLDDSIGIVMRPIPVSEMDNLTGDTKDFVQTIGMCIESIYDNDNVYSRNDCTQQELDNFVESLSHQHLELIDEYISNQPKLEHTLKFNCSHCNKKMERTMEGLQDFFV